MIITDNEFYEKYIPIMDNEETIKDFHPKVINDIEGDELDLAIKENRVWTLLDCDGHLWLTSGMHFVNRIDVYITEKPYESNQIIEIDWEL